MSLLSTPVMIAVLLSLPTLLFLHFLTLARNKRLPPSVPSVPLLGSFLTLYPFVRENKMYKFSELYHRTLGNFFYFSVFNSGHVSVADARCAKEILTTDKFIRGDTLRTVMKGLGRYQLFIIPSGEVWHKHRKFMQPSFGPSHQQDAFLITRDVTLQLVDVWNQIVLDNLKNVGRMVVSSDESAPVVNVYNCLLSLTLDVIGLMAFSYPFKMVSRLIDLETDDSDLAAFRDVPLVVGKRSNLPQFLWKHHKVSVEDMKVGSKKLRGIVSDVIASKRKKMAEGTTEKLDMLGRLLEATSGKAQVSFTEEELVDEIFTVFAGGSEPTANTIASCILALCQNPHVYSKLQAAIDKAYPNPDDLPTWENIHEIGYLNSALRETLRLYSVSGVISRVSTEPVSMMGYVIPSGTHFHVNVREIHRNVEYWPDPLKFDPERWETGEIPDPGTYLPFGHGPMNCIGQKIAMVEAKVVLSVLLKRFRFVLIPGQDLEPIQGIGLQYKHGVNVRVIPRTPMSGFGIMSL